MAPIPLPDASSSTIQLVHPDHIQKHALTVRNSTIWRGALSQEAYLRREEYLAKQSLTRKSGITYWILVDIAEPEKSRRVLCGCETIRKRAIFAHDGKVENTTAHCISNVFCPPEYCGRGFATRMMKELGDVLVTYQSDEIGTPNLFSVLWSDIGKTFYARHGWKPFPSAHIQIPSASAALSAPSSCEILKAKWLYLSDLKALCAIDEETLRETLVRRSTISPPAVALLPDFKTASWHYAREEFIGTELYGMVPEIKGAVISGPLHSRAWCYWSSSWCNSDRRSSKGNTLQILRLVIEDEYESQELHHPSTLGDSDRPDDRDDSSIMDSSSESSAYDVSLDEEGLTEDVVCRKPREQRIHAEMIRLLLHMAQVHAKLWNMENVEIWNPSPEVVRAAALVHDESKVIHREKRSISSMKWFASEDGSEKIEWVGNEKYGWC